MFEDVVGDQERAARLRHRTEMPDEKRGGRSTRIAALVLVAIGMLLAWRFGVIEKVAAPRALAQDLVAMGVWGYVAFVVAYIVLQPFGAPGTVFVIAASLIWPWPIAFTLSMIGTMGASVVGFSFVRFIARDWVAKRLPARFAKYNESLEKSAFRTVVLLRMIFWMPQMLHAFFAVSKVRFSTHFWGSLLGYIPPLLLVSYLGSQVFDDAGHLQPKAWPIMAGMLGVSLVLFAILRCTQRVPRGALDSGR